MKIHIIARSDRGAYLAKDPDCDFLVLSRTLDPADIHIGDALECNFDDTGTLTFQARNLTRNTVSMVGLEFWGKSLPIAVSVLVMLREPEHIFTGSKSFATSSRDVVDQIKATLSPL